MTTIGGDGRASLRRIEAPVDRGAPDPSPFGPSWASVYAAVAREKRRSGRGSGALRRIGAIELGLAAGAMAVAAGLIGAIAGAFDPFGLDRTDFALVAAPLLFGLATATALRFRRAAFPSRDRLRARDRRPEVLYLRSFRDEGLEIQARRRATTFNAGVPVYERLEGAIGRWAGEIGPFVAVADPDSPDDVPQAALTRYDDAGWRDGVRAQLAEAALAVVLLGGSRGVAWELEELIRRGWAGKAVLVAPPADSFGGGAAGAAERWERWALASAHMDAAAPGLAAPDADLTGVLAAYVEPSGGLALVASDGETSAHLRAALDAALYGLEFRAASR